MLESVYQARLIKKLQRRYPDAVIEKNNSSYTQGMPDLTIFIGQFWAKLEVKASQNAPEQPNQRYYVELFNGMSFAAFIHPDNEVEVLDALQQALESSWYSRLV